jgi:2-keto-4-pentenoate hydratase/2-oxohepta-3-ene-1,7-dioic acid hydratase in catechol pathway
LNAPVFRATTVWTLPGAAASLSYMYANYVVDGERRVGFFDGAVMRRLPGVTDTDALVAGGFPSAPPASGPIETQPVQFLPAILRPGKIICLLRSYGAHAREGGHEPPPAPNFFAKLPSALAGHLAAIEIPRDLEGEVHHEGELALVVGRPGRRIRAESALDHVAAYTVANDVTARTLQKADAARGWPWLRAKSPDRFLPLGPGLVPRSAVRDPHDLSVVVRVNGAVRQDGRTRNLLWTLGEILAEVSRWITLEAGDLVLTGTPEGVGPLVAGDVVEVEIPGIGRLENPVTRERVSA